MTKQSAAVKTLIYGYAAIATAQTPAPTLNPTIHNIVSAISEDRIAATEKKLESFGTRFVLSAKDDPNHGIGAAQRWIFDQFKSYSPRLEVTLDKETAKDIAGTTGDTELVNVIATLPGRLYKDRYIIVSAHYDSVALIEKTGGNEAKQIATLVKGGLTEPQARHYLKLFPTNESQWSADRDWKATAASPAPGVTDDGSGIAAVMELARVMSQTQFDKTVIFIAFSGEEIGLKGSTGYAAKAKEKKMTIEAVLNNDIIGTDVAGDGIKADNTLRVFSAGPEDSVSRSLARYMKEISERYVPEMKVEMVFREDRFGRGGDHTPLSNAGYAAVRLTTPAENFSHQHTVSDTFANTSPAYATAVTRMNAAVLATLASAPPPPVITWNIPVGPTKRTNIPLITRGKSHYDAMLRWEPAKGAAAASYAVLVRPTTSPAWEKQTDVGPVTTYRMPDFSIDDVVIGVRAIGKDGSPSLVSAYVEPPRFLPAAKPDNILRYAYIVLAFAGLLLALALFFFLRVARAEPAVKV